MTTLPRGRMVRLVTVLIVCAVLISACGGDGPYVPAGIIRTPAPDVNGVVVPDADGGEVRFVADEGGLLIVYFGYTSCPDVCPTTMADVRSALRDLGEDAERIDVAMVTVDPDRDTPEVLTAYVKAFVEDGIAITTRDADLLAAAAEPFGAQYAVTVQDDGWIDVIHSGFLYAVDDEGLLRLTWPFGVDSDLIEADMRAYLDGRLDADV